MDELFAKFKETVTTCIPTDTFFFNEENQIFKAKGKSTLVEYNTLRKEWRYDSNSSGIVGVGKNIIAASISHYKALEI